MKKLLGMLMLMIVLTPLASAADLQADLMAIEKSLWTAWGKKDGEPFKKVLTADAVEVVAGAAPIVGREEIAKSITVLPCELRSFAFKGGTSDGLRPSCRGGCIPIAMPQT